MSALEKIAFFQDRRDEVPNQELARELATANDLSGVREIAENLHNKNKNISSDCLKVMYEIGYLKPDLIAPYAGDFLALLESKDNRKVWGAMIALVTIGDIQHAVIATHTPEVIGIIRKGTLITTVWGVRLLAKVAARHPELQTTIINEFTRILKSCLPRDVPTHLESMLPALNKENLSVLMPHVKGRIPEMTTSHQSRLKKVMKKIG
jgi:hypothetical protein